MLLMAKKFLRLIAILMLVFINISCDQVSKAVVRKSVFENERISIAGDYLTLTRIENSGAFLSLGDSWPAPVKTMLLLILPLIVLTLSLWLVIRNKNISQVMLVGICFVIGGGIGNIFDRVVYGSVTDFLHMDFYFFQTGIFNMADVSIMLGIFMVLVEHAITKKRNLS